MKKTRTLSFILAIVMVFAILPFSISAEGEKATYDLTGIFSGATCGNGAISFAYGVADSAATLAADPSKLIALDKLVTEVEGSYSGANWFADLMYKSTAGDEYAHFVRNPGNKRTCLMPHGGVQNAIVFTAPVNGDYTFNAQIYNGWGGTDTAFEAYANGNLIKKQTIGSGNNVTTFETTDATYLKAGERMYIFFVHSGSGDSYIRIDSFTIAGTAITRLPTASYDLTGIFSGATCANGAISFAYGVADTATELAADPSKLIALDKLVTEVEGSFSGANWFADLMYKSTAGDEYAHFVRNPGNKRTCLMPRGGVQNAIVFTAPVNGDYTFSTQVYNGWGATDTVFEAYAKGKLVKKQTIGSGNNVTTFETTDATYLNAGEQMYIFFVHSGSGDSYIRIDSFAVKGTEITREATDATIFGTPDEGEGAVGGIDGGYYTNGSGEIESYALAFTAKFSDFNTIKDSIKNCSYGMYIYREGNFNGKVSTNTPEALTEYFYTVIDGIAEENKDVNIYVIPYVVIGEVTYSGSAMIACAGDFAGNWLGNAE